MSENLEMRAVLVTLYDVMYKMLHNESIEYETMKDGDVIAGTDCIRGVVITDSQIRLYNSNKIGPNYSIEDEHAHYMDHVVKAIKAGAIKMDLIENVIKNGMRIRVLGDITRDPKTNKITDNRKYVYIGMMKETNVIDAEERYESANNSEVIILTQKVIYFNECPEAIKDPRHALVKYAKYALRNKDDFMIHYLIERNLSTGYKQSLSSGNFSYLVDTKNGAEFINSSIGCEVEKASATTEADGMNLLSKIYENKYDVDNTLSFESMGFIATNSTINNLYTEKDKRDTNYSMNIGNSSTKITIPNIRFSQLNPTYKKVLSEPGIVILPKRSLSLIINADNIDQFGYLPIIQMAERNQKALSPNVEIMNFPMQESFNKEEQAKLLKGSGFSIIYDTDNNLHYKTIVELAKEKTVIVEIENLEDISSIDSSFLFETPEDRAVFIGQLTFIGATTLTLHGEYMGGYRVGKTLRQLLIDRKYYIFDKHLTITSTVENKLARLIDTNKYAITSIDYRRGVMAVEAISQSGKKANLVMKDTIPPFLILKYLIEREDINNFKIEKENYTSRIIKVQTKTVGEVIFKASIKINETGVTYKFVRKQLADDKRIEATLNKWKTSTMLLTSPGRILNIYGPKGSGKSYMMNHFLESIDNNETVVVIDMDRDIISERQNTVYFRDIDKLDVQELSSYNARLLLINTPIPEKLLMKILLNKSDKTTVIFATKVEYAPWLLLLNTDESRLVSFLLNEEQGKFTSYKME